MINPNMKYLNYFVFVLCAILMTGCPPGGGVPNLLDPISGVWEGRVSSAGTTLFMTMTFRNGRLTWDFEATFDGQLETAQLTGSYSVNNAADPQRLRIVVDEGSINNSPIPLGGSRELLFVYQIIGSELELTGNPDRYPRDFSDGDFYVLQRESFKSATELEGAYAILEIVRNSFAWIWSH